MYLTQVADGDSQGIGGVVGLRDFGKPELESDHLLNLLLAAGSIIGDPLLYLGWCILVGRDMPVGSGQEGYRLGSAYGHGRPYVFGDKGLLHRHGIGLMALDNFHKTVVQVAEALSD